VAEQKQQRKQLPSDSPSSADIILHQPLLVFWQLQPRGQLPVHLHPHHHGVTLTSQLHRALPVAGTPCDRSLHQILADGRCSHQVSIKQISSRYQADIKFHLLWPFPLPHQPLPPHWARKGLCSQRHLSTTSIFSKRWGTPLHASCCAAAHCTAVLLHRFPVLQWVHKTDPFEPSIRTARTSLTTTSGSGSLPLLRSRQTTAARVLTVRLAAFLVSAAPTPLNRGIYRNSSSSSSIQWHQQTEMTAVARGL